MNAIETHALTRRFGAHTAVDGLDLTVRQGELFALLGVNGAGKTTTLRMLSGLLQPTGGEADILGFRLTQQPQEIKRRINLSPQETAVAPNLTVRENLELIAGIYGASWREAAQRAAETIAEFHLGEVERSRAKTLSGGWQRRLSIAMALISQPQLVFLDEPTLGLDVLARRELWQVIRSLRGRVTVILTTHYLEEAEALSDRIGILPDILNTLYIVIATLLIVLPLGVGAAIYLTEYATNRRLIGAIEYAAETLSGIPSIIYGLVGMLFFCQFLNMKTSLLAGALTLVIMNLPTIMRTTQESLKTVPQSYREGAFGLGAGKWRVIRTVVLPGCVDGVITGCILSVGRILGESAALLFTAGFAHALNDFFEGLSSAGATLTVALYVYAKEQGRFDVAFAIAAILMILTLLINGAATLVERYFRRKRSL